MGHRFRKGRRIRAPSRAVDHTEDQTKISLNQPDKAVQEGPPIPTHQPRWVSTSYKLDRVCIAFPVEACVQAGQLIFDNSTDCWDDAPLRSDTHRKRLPHRIDRAAVRKLLPTSKRRTHRTSYRHSKYPLRLVPAVSRSGMEYGRDNSRKW
ncbi:unnamed protein product [Mycena citricolor]|uniref:Uncharacterized protein n=1 Tax=Mycena citricolor TaxID=2018698 RepID=A0AAD2HKF1_9AGAR|nr:unnamed protein product [Mycena citricolor]